jgi:prolyl-tRNA synthetase
MHDQAFVLLLIRGDHTLNEIKTQKLPGLDPFRFATDAEIVQHLGCSPGYIGPVGIDPRIRVIADRTVAAMADFVCGANDAGFHLTGVNWGRDLPEPGLVADIRNVVAGDPSPDGSGALAIQRGIEVGHIFQLRTKYSQEMKALFLDREGRQQPFEMGCYGIGVTRIVGAAIEQNHDAKGIIWPMPMAPFQLAIVPVGYHKSAGVREAADRLYADCLAAGIDALLDDRDERPGVMFADMELVGIPCRVVVGERGLRDGRIEFQGRRDEAAQAIPLPDALTLIKERLCASS